MLGIPDSFPPLFLNVCHTGKRGIVYIKYEVLSKVMTLFSEVLFLIKVECCWSCGLAVTVQDMHSAFCVLIWDGEILTE